MPFSRITRIVIETSTLPIEVKERARSRLDARGVVLLDCPISGTGAQARAGDMGRYRPSTMTPANFVKDLAIIAAFARKVGVRTPLLSAAAPIYAAATRKNPLLDTAAVCAVLERMAGTSARSSRRDSLRK